MSRTTKMLAAAVGVTLLSSAAQASISFVGLTPRAIAAGDVAADPTLAGYQSYDLQVSISPGDHWAAASLLGTLGTGTFYVPASFDADTGLQTIAAFVPNLNSDTFLSRPGLSDPGSGAVLGSASGAPSPTFPKASTDKKTIDVAWGDVNATQNNLSGIQTIARLTATTNAIGSFTGVLKVTSDPSSNTPFTFQIGGVVPEPTSLAMMGLGLGAVALRRRK